MAEHPLRTFARQNETTLAQIAEAAHTSRMTLHRVMNGENTTVDLLRRVSEATGGKVTVEQLVSPAATASATLTGTAGNENAA